MKIICYHCYSNTFQAYSSSSSDRFMPVCAMPYDDDDDDRERNLNTMGGGHTIGEKKGMMQVFLIFFFIYFLKWSFVIQGWKILMMTDEIFLFFSWEVKKMLSLEVIASNFNKTTQNCSIKCAYIREYNIDSSGKIRIHCQTFCVF